MNMDISDCEVFQYMIKHGNSWILESEMEYSSLLVSSYLTSQENLREVIKIEDEEMVPISGYSHNLFGDNKDLKDVLAFVREECMACESEIRSTQFPLKIILCFMKDHLYMEKVINSLQ